MTDLHCAYVGRHTRHYTPTHVHTRTRTHTHTMPYAHRDSYLEKGHTLIWQVHVHMHTYTQTRMCSRPATHTHKHVKPYKPKYSSMLRHAKTRDLKYLHTHNASLYTNTPCFLSPFSTVSRLHVLLSSHSHTHTFPMMQCCVCIKRVEVSFM